MYQLKENVALYFWFSLYDKGEKGEIGVKGDLGPQGIKGDTGNQGKPSYWDYIWFNSLKLFFSRILVGEKGV